MSFSVSKFLPGLAAAAGFSAFAMPMIAPWETLLLLSSAICAIAIATGRHRLYVSLLSFLVTAAALDCQLSASFAAASLAATGLVMARQSTLATVVLALNLSIIASAQAILGNLLFVANLEAAAPAVAAAAILLMASTCKRHIALVVGSIGLATGGVYATALVASAPDTLMTIAALPVVFTAAVLASAKTIAPPRIVPVGALFAAALATWLWNPPKTTDETWVLLPDAPETYEAKFFNNYAECLRFAGVPAKVAASVEEIPKNATVLMPWMTAPYQNESRIRVLARERHWTIVFGGEHTNLGGVADRIAAIVGRPLLRTDLSVPRANSDRSGPLRMASLNAWNPASIFNRGASVTITSVMDKVILDGDGWWIEPDIAEWLWVGDYVWRQEDRSGRITMGAIFNISGARWMVLGDNSPMINRQVVADPRALIQILQAVTLWPAFIQDLILLASFVLIIASGNTLLITAVPVCVAFFASALERPGAAWYDAYIGESGFDDRNFNNAIADNPALVSQRRLVRLKHQISGRVQLPNEPATVFMLVDNAAEIGGVSLDRCRRMGSLATTEGPVLMDAQACRVTGQAEILIGTKEAAAAIKVGKTIVILDTVFLGQKASTANITWLLKTINP